MEDPKRPSDAAPDGATVTGAPAVGVSTLPPTMPSPSIGGPPILPSAGAGPPPMPPEPSFGGPPPMPSEPSFGGPPPMPSEPSFSGPPPMPSEPSFGGPPPMPSFGAGPPPMPGAFPAMPGTMQMPFGAAPGEAAAPIMATVTGGPLPDVAPPSMPPPSRYELGREIARGGMGRVVEANDTLLNRTVALKEVLAMDADVLRRFARETRITARLEHPSIVPLHDAGTTAEGAPFYVMRKISGRPLEHLVALAETLNQRLILVPHIVAAAQAVAHAHERGIVHRDIKPSNILVGDLGEAIVIDWGLAKVIGETDDLSNFDLSASLIAVPTASGAASSRTGGAEAIDTETADTIKTRAGIVFGTPGFMAPEQLRGLPVTEQCDVYALGATLYHLLSRKPPHHAKTADEMMRAAARQPATPIAELVPGVPPELSTIVDKALAFDPAERYPDARALAEDLQRFLSGQLVASHRYTPRERLVRFVRKHRVPVIIASSALAALIVIGAIAVLSVVRERDRADVERDAAVQRAEWLALAQARAEVDRDPTRAIAIVKPLAGRPEYWLEVRTIAAAARAHGVAYGLPASKTTESLVLSRDGTRALAGGADGVVRLYDLPKRTWSELPISVGGAATTRFADGDRKVVAWRDRTIAVAELAGGAARTLTAPTKIKDLEVVGTTAYWVDEPGALWQGDLAGAAPAQIALPERVHEVAPSPDGRVLALFGHDHLLLLDRTQPAEPIEVRVGKTKRFDWSADGTKFGALIDDDGILGSVEAPHIEQQTFVNRRLHVAHSVDRVYVFGPTGVGMVMRGDAKPRKQIDGLPIGLRQARGNVLVAATSARLVVLSELGDREIAVPTGKLQLVEASPRAPYVVGAIEGRLLVWNLDDLEPRRLAKIGSRPVLTQLLGTGQALAAFEDDEPAWIDLGTGAATPLGEWSPRFAAAAPSGQLACAIDEGRRARLLAPGKEPVLLEGQFEVAGFASDHELLLGDGESGTVRLYDPRSGKLSPLVTSRGKLLDLAWNRARPAWVAGLFGGGTLWRRNLATGAEATTPFVATSGHTQVLKDGTVMFADQRTIRAWRPSGAVDVHAELPRRVVSIGLAGPAHLLAILDDDSAWLVDLTAPGRAEETESVGTSARFDDDAAARAAADRGERRTVPLSMAVDTGTLVIPNSGGLAVVDAVGRHTWTLAVKPPPPSLYDPASRSYAGARISADGTRVVAWIIDDRRPETQLVTWPITVPPSPAETAAWVESLTNATLDGRRANKLIWR